MSKADLEQVIDQIQSDNSVKKLNVGGFKPMTTTDVGLHILSQTHEYIQQFLAALGISPQHIQHEMDLWAQNEIYLPVPVQSPQLKAVYRRLIDHGTPDVFDYLQACYTHQNNNLALLLEKYKINADKLSQAIRDARVYLNN